MDASLATLEQPRVMPHRGGRDDASRRRLHLFVFVGVVGCVGALVLFRAVTEVRAWLPFPALVLALLTVVTSRFVIKVPGRPATVSVSEVFVFASAVLYGPGPATLTVALDGLWMSIRQQDRRLYRAIFNIAEPAISAHTAATVFVVLSHQAGSSLVLAAAGMSLTYLVLNSGLQATAIALETGASAMRIWLEQSLYLTINYYTAAALATLIVQRGSGLSFDLLGLVAPLVVLTYVAYKNAAIRIDEAQRHVQEVEHLYQATVATLATAVDAKDQVTHGHIRRVQRHTLALAGALGVTDPFELKALAAASLLHDVGKLAVPEYVLNKPGSLTASEFARMKLHAAKGAEILAAVEFPYPVVPIVRHHHEYWDGGGYPDGLSGAAIPLGARILTVVDCFDALTSDRPYRRRMTDAEAVAILHERRGSMYDPAVVDAFIAIVPALRRDDETIQQRAAAPAPAAADPARREAARCERPQVASSPQWKLAARLRDVMPAADACLFVPARDESGELVLADATARTHAAAASLRVEMGDGVVGWVAVHRHTLVNSNPDLDFGDAAIALGLRSCTATPVIAFGELVGVLAVYLPQRRGFSEADVRVVGAVAQELGWEALREMNTRSATSARAHSA
ncbi:MAG: HD domain-containing protein [Acidobacteria bacterium]|nr:HD domain-containing protein [Acidobacteriota bacterium]